MDVLNLFLASPKKKPLVDLMVFSWTMKYANIVKQDANNVYSMPQSLHVLKLLPDMDWLQTQPLKLKPWFNALKDVWIVISKVRSFYAPKLPEDINSILMVLLPMVSASPNVDPVLLILLIYVLRVMQIEKILLIASAKLDLEKI